MFFGTVSWPEFEISVHGNFGAASKKAGVAALTFYRKLTVNGKSLQGWNYERIS